MPLCSLEQSKVAVTLPHVHGRDVAFFFPLKLIWAAQVMQIMLVSSKVYTVRVCLRVSLSTAAQQGNTLKKQKKNKTSAELCIKDCWFGLSSLPFIKLQKGISSHSRPVCEKGMITATRSCPCENCLNKYRHEKYEPILVLPVSGWFRNSSISTCWKWCTVMFTAQWAPSSGLPVISSYYKQILTQP